MATFRSRQRASQRRDGKREAPASQPETASKPATRPAAAPAAAETPRRTFAKTGKPAAGKAPERRDRTPPTEAPRPAMSKADKAPSDTTRTTPAPASETDAPRRLFPKTGRSAERSAPQEQERAPASDLPRRSFLKTGKSGRPDAATPRQPDTEPTPRPLAAPGATEPEQTPPRRRLMITPASEVGTPQAARPATPAPRMSPAEETTAARPQPASPAPAQHDKPVRKRLIAPAGETPAHEAGTQGHATAETRPALRMPNRHAPEQRRGLPATETRPTERPAFERRSAEPRRQPGAPAHMALFASCPRGLEPVLRQELQRLGAEDIAPVDGGVGFTGSFELLMRVNLESRVASRVLLRLAHGGYRSEREVNALSMQVDWPRYFDVSRTIKVKTDGVGARVKSLDYVSLTVKDAVCDRFRQAQLGRPSVDTHAPDVRIQVFLGPDEASIYLDSSGDALFKRGWRRESGEAPLRENLAAGILLLSGYTGAEALLDPMCGSGTFLVEAADIALNRAPGRARSFAFEKWGIFDQALWLRLQDAARAAEKPARPLPLVGSDNDARMVAIARANLERAGLNELVTVEQRELFDCRPHATQGLIVTNPPYGVRLEEQDTLAALYPLMGDWLKQHFAGWTAHFFTGDLRLAKFIRLAVKRRIPLFNGALDCRLFVLPLVAGSARSEKNAKG